MLAGLLSGTAHKRYTLQWLLSAAGDRIGLLLLVLLTNMLSLSAQSKYQVSIVCSKPEAASIRALATTTDSAIWVSGTNGKVGRSLNDGNTWEWFMPDPNCDSCDFRSLHAFNRNKAVAIRIGQPAKAYLTQDGGKTWTNTLSIDTAGIFIDGLAFSKSGEGFAIGDPLPDANGTPRFVMLQTSHGSQWQSLPDAARPIAATGEAIFAASNTSLIILPDGTPCFVTGGTKSAIYKRKGNNWNAYTLPVIQGESGTGAFSVAFRDQQNGIVVGGNYKQDTLRYRNCFITTDGGKSWKAPHTAPSGYKSGVTWLNKNTLVATGTSGTDISFNGGLDWQKIGKGFNVVTCAIYKKKIFLAGKDIAVITIE
ncbi:oxidoreductase [Chitinophaga sp. Cy-1792]|uniref:WD40/YVTN/BNR-like repeat-containing protein n=1 Tax=Chitinophaga sp. Cy-1792 TaxID=2608339 RepID=UPI00141E1677|nr:oxidoreductase [Chitinophaga sp. Cy-1792]NIG54320.1 oxidoreductase [Chitinophaga sp. Cy-1792]